MGERIPVGDGPLVEGEDENRPNLSRGYILDVWVPRLRPAIAGGDGGADGRTWAKSGEVGGDGGADEAVRRWRDGGREVRRRADEAVRDLHAGPTDQKKRLGPTSGSRKSARCIFYCVPLKDDYFSTFSDFLTRGTQ